VPTISAVVNWAKAEGEIARVAKVSRTNQKEKIIERSRIRIGNLFLARKKSG
jgi:hypothetical protein